MVTICIVYLLASCVCVLVGGQKTITECVLVGGQKTITEDNDLEQKTI